MGHKVHPIGFRLGVIRDWEAKWYADAHYAEFLQEDLKVRKVIQTNYREAAISFAEINRQAKDVTVTIHTSRPGIVIGRGGQRVDEMRLLLEGLIGRRVRLNIQEIRQPELDACLVARVIADQIERRIAYRRAMKQAIFRTMQAGAKGIRVSCAGRLGDAEIARRQTMHEGQVPLHTLRADIDYGFTEAHTTLGRIGVKVWIYKGEILPELKEPEVAEVTGEAAREKAEQELPAAVETGGETAEPVAEAEPEVRPEPERVEASAVVETEKEPEAQPASPRVKRAKKAVTVEPGEKPVEPEVAEPEPEAAPAEKPAKPAASRKKKTEEKIEPEATAVVEEEEKDATTETG